MKKIKLTQGKVAIVDDEDFEGLNQVKWYADRNRNTWYAVRNFRRADGGRTLELMHRRILNAPIGKMVDHHNGDGLDDRRENLRLCTTSVNRQNQHTICGTSKYQGVTWDKRNKKWRAEIRINKKKIHIGRYKSEGLAAVAYNIAALRFIGIDAKLNEV